MRQSIHPQQNDSSSTLRVKNQTSSEEEIVRTAPSAMSNRQVITMQRLIGNQRVIQLLAQNDNRAEKHSQPAKANTPQIQRGGMTSEDAEMIGQGVGEALLWLGSALSNLWSTYGWGRSPQTNSSTSGDTTTQGIGDSQPDSSTLEDTHSGASSQSNPQPQPISINPISTTSTNPPPFLSTTSPSKNPEPSSSSPTTAIDTSEIEAHVQTLQNIVEWAKANKNRGLQRSANDVRIQLEKLLRGNKGASQIDFTPSEWKQLKRQIDQLGVEFQEAQKQGTGVTTTTTSDPSLYNGLRYQEVGTIGSNPRRLFVRLDRGTIQALQAGAHLTGAHLDQYETAMLKGQIESGSTGAAGIKYDQGAWVIKITISNAQSLVGADNTLSPVATNPEQIGKLIYLNFDGLVYRH